MPAHRTSDGRALFAEIRKLGYKGCYSGLAKFLSPWRQSKAETRRAISGFPDAPQLQVTTSRGLTQLSPQVAAALLSKARAELTSQQALIVDTLKRQCPGFAVMRKLVFGFRAILRGGKVTTLHRWMEEARKTGIQSRRFGRPIPGNHYLETATDPAERAQGFIVLSSAQLGAKDLDPATKSAEETLTLQPEGRLNAEGRMLIGDIESARGNYENAARSYMSVAVLYKDPEVTPRALQHAYEAFQKAGNEPQATRTLSELKTRFPNYSMKGTTAG